MTRLSMMKNGSVLALGLALFLATPAAAQTAECTDSAVGGTACGSGSVAADDATAVGFNSTASGEASAAFGEASTASGLFAVAIGKAALADADNATAVGTLAMATGTGSTAVGAGALAEGENSVAIGINANAIAPNSVALGANSVADQADTVSVGAVGDERRIVNVAAGIDATDAVNVGQLTAVSGQITGVTTALNAETSARIAGDTALGNQITGVSAALGNETSARIAGDALLSDQFDDLADDFRRGAREARGGTAAALAAAGLPQASDAGRTMISGGIGTYRGRAAFAVGASHRASNGQAVFKLGVTYDSSEHVGANAGIGFQF